MRIIDPGTIPTAQMHQILVGSIAPRPIALVSSLSEDGIPNLAPYSFFNVFGSDPATAVFSSVRSIGTGEKKDTLRNVEATRECVIHVVSHSILHQMALSSKNFPYEVDEFTKSGFTPISSDKVKPPRVKESPVHFECEVRDIYPLGSGGGGGSLIICNILRVHVEEEIFTEEDKIDPQRLDLMGRMGRAFYCRAKGENVFPIYMPREEVCIGFDGLPPHIRQSGILTGNDLGRLAALPAPPEPDHSLSSDPEIMDALAGNAQDRDRRLHLYAQDLIQKGEVEKAYQVLHVE